MAKTGSRTSTQTYKDDLNNPVVLGKELARGGEGRVCLVQGNPNVVAKIYLDKVLNKHSKAGKIKAMCNLYDKDIAKFSALPQRVIYNSRRKVVGFIMEKVTGFEEIHNLYGISTKRKLFDYADWGFMVHSAQNLAIAVDKLHRKNIIIGDINQGNILVNNQAMIKLIDCDSYQVEYNGNFYFCEVGVPEYTSPELQGQSFNGIPRTKNHDCFGLAVMIFKILMFGRHPYSGVGAPPEIEKAIRQGSYCYGNYSKGTTPIYSQLFSDVLSDEVKELFNRAFSKNKSIIRPTAEEWINTLAYFEKKLIQCSKNNNHKYFSNGNSCIWCKLSNSGFKPFNNPTVKTKPQNTPNHQQTPYKYNNLPKQKNTRNYNNPHQPAQLKQTQSTTNDNKLVVIIGIIIAIVVYVCSQVYFNDSKNTSYPPPVTNQETDVDTTQENTEQQTESEQKIYTEAEIQADINTYKNKFITKVKPNWHPERVSFLFDNNSLEVRVDKHGNVTFPEFEKRGFDDNANTNLMKHTIEYGVPYDPLPDSYNNETLTFRIYFEGNTDSYWGNAKPKASYQVSLSPIKQVSRQIQQPQTPKPNTNAPASKPVTPQPKPNTTIDKPATSTTTQKPSTNTPSKPKTDVQKSTDYFFE